MVDYHEDRKDSKGNWIKTYAKGGKQVVSRSAQLWYDLRKRTNPDSPAARKRPNYIGCVLADEFKDFQSFAAWHSTQVGYGLGYHLDKDILFNENRIYGPETCVLVPAALNSFFTDRKRARGKFPQGVTQQQDSGTYVVVFTEFGECVYLGSYRTVEEASEAYKKGKESAARKWVNRLTSGEYTVDPRVVERMQNYKFVEGVTNGG